MSVIPVAVKVVEGVCDMMVNDRGVWQQNADNSWSQAIPLPFYGIKKRCGCGKSFWKEENYKKHYVTKHTDGKRYRRTPQGLFELKEGEEI